MTKEVAVDDVGAREIVLGPYYLEPGPALICISVSTSLGPYCLGLGHVYYSFYLDKKIKKIIRTSFDSLSTKMTNKETWHKKIIQG
jgi:hypothetical protein